MMQAVTLAIHENPNLPGGNTMDNRRANTPPESSFEPDASRWNKDDYYNSDAYSDDFDFDFDDRDDIDEENVSFVEVSNLRFTLLR